MENSRRSGEAAACPTSRIFHNLAKRYGVAGTNGLHGDLLGDAGLHPHPRSSHRALRRQYAVRRGGGQRRGQGRERGPAGHPRRGHRHPRAGTGAGGAPKRRRAGGDPAVARALGPYPGAAPLQAVLRPGNAVRIWGSRQGTTSLEAILRQQMDPAVFPVPLDALSAKLTVQQVEPGEFTVGTFRVRAIRLRHPGTTLGYRLTPAAGGPSMAYITDNELGAGGRYSTPASWRKEFVAFLNGVQLLIHDAMYTPEELEEHSGWGHSTSEEAVALAADAAVKRLVLFHHEPEHGDAEMDALLDGARRQARMKGLPAEVVAAQEGMTLTL